jgi:hypothetical protein
MFEYMYETLNIDKNNELHNLHEFCEKNLLKLISP